MSRKLRRYGLRVVTVLALLFVATVWGAGELLSAPSMHMIGPAPLDLDAEKVHIIDQDVTAAADIQGWLVRGRPHMGVVLLLHGIDGDRTDMLRRARFLKQLGYTVLLIDLPAHGESKGDRITFGMHEGMGVHAALMYLAQHYPLEKIGVIGVSLGAASFVLSEANAHDPMVSAVVLESMFPTIREAVQDRLDQHLGSEGHLLAPLLLTQLPLRLGITPEQLRPEAVMPDLHMPVLIASGSMDPLTRINETLHLYQVANAPKQLWVVDGATHQDLYDYAPKSYESRIANFLGSYLHTA